MKFIYKSEKKRIIKKLEYYGITKIPHLLLRFGREKIRGYTGSLSTDEISNIDHLLRVESLGVYLFHEYSDEIRLSSEAIDLFKTQISKNIIQLNDNQIKQWFLGQDIPIIDDWKKQDRGFKIIKHKDDFISCGKLTNDRLINYLPKEKRIKPKRA